VHLFSVAQAPARSVDRCGLAPVASPPPPLLSAPLNTVPASKHFHPLFPSPPSHALTRFDSVLCRRPLSTHTVNTCLLPHPHDQNSNRKAHARDGSHPRFTFKVSLTSSSCEKKNLTTNNGTRQISRSVKDHGHNVFPTPLYPSWVEGRASPA